MLDSPRSLGSGQTGRRPRLDSRVLRQAGDVYDRAARSPYGRVPQPTPAGNQPRHAARLLSAFARLTGCGSIISIVLVTRVGRARRSRRRTPRRPAGRRPGRRRSRRRRTAVRRHWPGATPSPARQCPSTRRTLLSPARCIRPPGTGSSKAGPQSWHSTSTRPIVAPTARPQPLTLRTTTLITMCPGW